MEYKTEEVAEYISLSSTRSKFVQILQRYFGFSRDDSQDIYSSAVFNVYSYSRKNEGINLHSTNLENYFRTSVFNEAKSFINSKRRGVFSLNELEEKVGGNSPVFEDNPSYEPEKREEIENLIIKLAENLNSDYQKIILAYVEDPSISYKSIGNLFDKEVSLNTIKTKIRRARKKIWEEARSSEELSEKIYFL